MAAHVPLKACMRWSARWRIKSGLYGIADRQAKLVTPLAWLPRVGLREGGVPSHTVPWQRVPRSSRLSWSTRQSDTDVIAPAIRAERRRRTSELRFASPPVATRNGLASASG